MQIQLDLEALERQIASDPIIIELTKKRQQWQQHQAEKRQDYKVKMEAARLALKGLEKDLAESRRKVSAKRGEINRFKVFARFRYTGLKTIERNISRRRQFLKRHAIEKASAEAQRAAMKEWNRKEFNQQQPEQL